MFNPKPQAFRLSILAALASILVSLITLVTVAPSQAACSGACTGDDWSKPVPLRDLPTKPSCFPFQSSCSDLKAFNHWQRLWNAYMDPSTRQMAVNFVLREATASANVRDLYGCASKVMNPAASASNAIAFNAFAHYFTELYFLKKSNYTVTFANLVLDVAWTANSAYGMAWDTLSTATAKVLTNVAVNGTRLSPLAASVVAKQVLTPFQFSNQYSQVLAGAAGVATASSRQNLTATLYSWACTR